MLNSRLKSKTWGRAGLAQSMQEDVPSVVEISGNGEVQSCMHRVKDLIVFAVLHRWGLMGRSLHRSRCTSCMKSKCSATRISPTLNQEPQVQTIHADTHSRCKTTHNSAHLSLAETSTL